MSDSSAYINAYIDNAVAMLHENMNVILQMKTQAAMTANLLSAKNDQVENLQVELNELREKLESTRSDLEKEFDSSRSDLQTKLDYTVTELEKTKTVDNEEINKARGEARKWEEEYNALKRSQGAVDTLTNQFNEVKKQVITKTQELNNLTEQFNSLKQENESLKNSVTELENVKNLLAKKEKQVQEYENLSKKSSQSAPKKTINNKNIVPSIGKTEEKDDDF
jgi:chromosome segregation ATPase